jgi:RNA polymerase sigma factor (sigma-70 family)
MAAEELATLTAGLGEDVVAIAVLHYVDGMTQDEIAEALDLSRRTVGKRLKRFATHTQALTGRSAS